MSNAVLLAQQNDVVVVDINQEKVDQVNRFVSPVVDLDIQDFLTNKKITMRATTDLASSCHGADYVLVATPTNFDPFTGTFDTSSVEGVLKQIFECGATSLVIIRSTVPVGFTEKANKNLKTDRIIFSPEFLREGKALHDCLHPSRIIIGEKSSRAEKISKIFLDCSHKENISVVYTSSKEAESIKLFANAYLAMRVAYFNESDNFALDNHLSTRSIIEGLCLDPRIGTQYNNPSFGYGGYCLPKDTAQLQSTFKNTPQSLISAIIESNSKRKYFITRKIIELQPDTVGVYSLAMKKDASNYREAAIIDVIENLTNHGIKILIYEPNIKYKNIRLTKITDSIEYFKKTSDIIITNRLHQDLVGVSQKVFSRDIFERD